jgi:hypothetical protein
MTAEKINSTKFRLGKEGEGFRIAMSGLDGGRLSIGKERREDEKKREEMFMQCHRLQTFASP